MAYAHTHTHTLAHTYTYGHTDICTYTPTHSLIVIYLPYVLIHSILLPKYSLYRKSLNMRPGTGATVKSICFNLLGIDFWTRNGTKIRASVALRRWSWTIICNKYGKLVFARRYCNISVRPSAALPIGFIAVVRVVFGAPRGSFPHEYGRTKKQIYFGEVTSTEMMTDMMPMA